jgi:acyl-CoA synthetase (AMP-forming)/AMP-acid ligase II
MRYARTLWELLERRVDATPDALMAVDEDMRTLTFAEFWSEAELAAAGLAAAGVGAGDVVTWQLPTWIEALVLTAALSRLEVVQNPVLPSFRERELEGITDRTGSSLLVTPSVWRGFDHEEMATAIARRDGAMRVLLADRALPQGDPTALAPLPPAEVADGQPVRWLFATSGTTAEPKLVQHTDASLMAAARGMSQRLGLIPQDRNALVFPVTHIGGIVWLLASLESGCANILCDVFDPERTVEVLGREGVTLAGSGTYFHQTYLAEQRRRLGPIFPDVRAFPGGGAPKPATLAQEIRSVFEVPVVSGYGSTEAPIVTMASASDSDEELDCSEGKPTHGVEIRFVGADGRLVDPGEVGEIRVRAPQMMRGYLDPASDQVAFDDDGFFCTGDLGRMDSYGNLVVTGRTKDIIVRKGENVSAKEVEDLLVLHDKVLDVAVIGLPDPDSGERVCAVVQVAGEDRVSFDEIIVHLRDRGLMTQKLPEQLEIVDTLPRNASGKVLKDVLRDEFKG